MFSTIRPKRCPVTVPHIFWACILPIAKREFGRLLILRQVNLTCSLAIWNWHKEIPILHTAFIWWSRAQMAQLPIGEHAFAYCISLESCALPSALQKVKDQLFSECSSLKCVVIGENVTEIARLVFWNCEALQNVDFSNAKQLKTIGESAFGS